MVQFFRVIILNIFVLLIFNCILLLCDIGIYTHENYISKVQLITILKQNGEGELYKYIYDNGVRVGYRQGYNDRIYYELQNNIVLIAEPSSAK